MGALARALVKASPITIRLKPEGPLVSLHLGKELPGEFYAWLEGEYDTPDSNRASGPPELSAKAGDFGVLHPDQVAALRNARISRTPVFSLLAPTAVDPVTPPAISAAPTLPAPAAELMPVEKPPVLLSELMRHSQAAAAFDALSPSQQTVLRFMVRDGVRLQDLPAAMKTILGPSAADAVGDLTAALESPPAVEPVLAPSAPALSEAIIAETTPETAAITNPVGLETAVQETRNVRLVGDLDAAKPVLFNWLLGDGAADLKEAEIGALRQVLPEEGEYSPTGFRIHLARAADMAKTFAETDPAYKPAAVSMPDYTEEMADWLDALIDQYGLDVDIQVTLDAAGQPHAQAFKDGKPLILEPFEQAEKELGIEITPLDTGELELVKANAVNSTSYVMRRARLLAAMECTEETSPPIGVNKWDVLARAMKSPFKAEAKAIIAAARARDPNNRGEENEIGRKIRALQEAMEKAGVPDLSLAEQPIGWEQLPEGYRPTEVEITHGVPSMHELMDDIYSRGILQEQLVTKSPIKTNSGVRLTTSAPCQCGEEFHLANAPAIYRGVRELRGIPQEVYELVQPCTCPHCQTEIEVYLGELDSGLAPFDRMLGMIQDTAMRETGYAHRAKTVIMAQDEAHQKSLVHQYVNGPKRAKMADGRTGFYCTDTGLAVCSPAVAKSIKRTLGKHEMTLDDIRHMLHETVVHPSHYCTMDQFPEKLLEYRDDLTEFEETAARLVEMLMANMVAKAMPELGASPIRIDDYTMRKSLQEPQYEKVYDVLRGMLPSGSRERDLPLILMQQCQTPEGMASVFKKYLQNIGEMPSPKPPRSSAMDEWSKQEEIRDQERLLRVRRAKASAQFRARRR